MEPKWNRSERFERSGCFDVKGEMQDVFPLLCPALEYQWIPGWSCTMLYSDSGVAEENAIFSTREMFGKKVLRTTITYEPNRFIEYLLVMGQDGVVRLSITLEEKGPGETLVHWRMLLTAVSYLAKKILPKAYSEDKFQAMLSKRKNELNRYLATTKK